MSTKQLKLNNMGVLSNVSDPHKNSIFASLITRAWKGTELTQQQLRIEYRLQREEKLRASKGLVFGGLLGAMSWCAIVIGFNILF